MRAAINTLSCIPPKSVIVLGYLRHAQWGAMDAIAKKTAVKKAAVNGALKVLCQQGKVLHVHCRDGDHIYVYIPIKRRKAAGGAS
jgi:predicted transcriptional regulator